MKKTLAELRRDAAAKRFTAEIVFRFGDKIPERLKGERKISRTNTVAIFFVNQNGEESELQLPPASLVEYGGDFLEIYAPAVRELTDAEKDAIAAYERSEEEYKAKYNGCGRGYWYRRMFFENAGFPYLGGADEFLRGKRYRAYDNKVIDKGLRGELNLRYKLTRNDR